MESECFHRQHGPIGTIGVEGGGSCQTFVDATHGITATRMWLWVVQKTVAHRLDTIRHCQTVCHCSLNHCAIHQITDPLCEFDATSFKLRTGSPRLETWWNTGTIAQDQAILLPLGAAGHGRKFLLVARVLGCVKCSNGGAVYQYIAHATKDQTNFLCLSKPSDVRIAPNQRSRIGSVMWKHRGNCQEALEAKPKLQKKNKSTQHLQKIMTIDDVHTHEKHKKYKMISWEHVVLWKNTMSVHQQVLYFFVFFKNTKKIQTNKL